ncbi:MAG: hypothetical protein A2731_01800 [Candidatus Buchananbacteria bacterium RIFCSPHIGHO2_01_FULL_39_8]|uniref:Transposase IS200-like domain-containing protein n=1 Tax=Candidatus Buchananbacteria bacterium RIFCSPHIGHO2_01_FULL_39_8 TaxID=1797533 RepID=A0A1G1XZ77_9BACT|nr:MAG: hypothetical protein A2731_01800 [Candidatus Buchananbacteria bacterium RIFCSPHIGHO2_01_FULL_39_8]
MNKKFKNKPRRIYLESQIYFVTVKTFYNQPIFKNNKNATIFLWALNFLKQRGDFELSAGVLLYDHFHLLLIPIKKNISEIMHDLKSYVANRINYNRRGRDASPLGINNQHNHRQGLCALPFVKIWQSSFYCHLILSEQDLENHFNYIIWNPVKHGYVARSEDWPYLYDLQAGLPRPANGNGGAIKVSKNLTLF